MLISSTEFEVSSPIRWIGCSYTIALRVSRYLFLFFGIVAAASLQIAGSAIAQNEKSNTQQHYEQTQHDRQNLLCVAQLSVLKSIDETTPGFIERFGSTEEEIVRISNVLLSDPFSGPIALENGLRAGATEAISKHQNAYFAELSPLYTAELESERQNLLNETIPSQLETCSIRALEIEFQIEANEINRSLDSQALLDYLLNEK